MDKEQSEDEQYEKNSKQVTHTFMVLRLNYS